MANPYPTGSPGLPDAGMPSAAPSIVPRRSSYASVVSGTASQSYQPARSGAFSHLLNQNDYPYDSNYQNYGGQSRYDPRTFDIEFGSNGISHGRSASWGKLHTHSRAFAGLINGNGHGGGSTDQFFTPSYLKDSKYVQTLQETNKAKALAQKETPSAATSQPGSLSTSASSLNLHSKMPASHRGMTYDLIEKVSPVEDEGLPPLPSKWSSQDKNPGLEVLSDGLEVKFTGVKNDRERDHEACAIRADHFMPPQCGIYYFEVTIISRKREETSIGIGFSGKNVPLSRLPGWEPDSYAYHGDDGKAFSAQSTGRAYGPPFQGNDVIGCGVNFRNGTAFFTKNGDHLGTAFRDIKGKLFPSVGMKKAGEHIRVNFGQSPFSFDIDGMMAASQPPSLPQVFALSEVALNRARYQWRQQRRVEAELYSTREKAAVRQQIEATSAASLAPPLSEAELIQQLVVQYLQHEGYTETAKAFASEVQIEKQALTLDPNAIVDSFEVKEDEDASHRQRIRAAVLEGDIEKALEITNTYYPEVLKENENVYFRLRCRRLIEMIRQGAEMQHGSQSHPNGTKKSNGHGGGYYDDAVNQDMDLDDHPSSNGNWDKMDTEDTGEKHMDYDQLLQDTIAYGQNLQAEFKDDPRREISKALNDAFALLAYQDPLAEKDIAHRLDTGGRVPVAEELNSAILLSLGRSSSAALEQVIQQTTVLLEELSADGGPGAFVNIDDFVRPGRGPYSR